jgi:hypothetical protein
MPSALEVLFSNITAFLTPDIWGFPPYASAVLKIARRCNVQIIDGRWVWRKGL